MSFTFDGDDDFKDDLGDMLDIQTVKLENERLQNLNRNLESSLANMKVQLKEALESSASVTTMNQQIIDLKAQLHESRMLQNERSTARDTNDSLLRTEIGKQKQTLGKLTKKIDTLKLEKEQLTSECDDMKRLVETLKLKAEKKEGKYKENMKLLLTKFKANEDQIQELQLSKEDVERELETTKAEVESLKVQLKAAAAASENVEVEPDDHAVVYEFLAKQIEEQKDEINELNAHKSTALELIRKMQSALVASENYCDRLVRENEQWRSKVRILSDNTSKMSSPKDIQIPFQGELLNQCEMVMAERKYKPSQKMQLVLNEAARAISELEEEGNELEKRLDDKSREADQLFQSEKMCKEMFNAFLNELKNVAGSVNDPDFTEFMRRNPISVSVEEAGSVPDKFFSMSELDKARIMDKCMSASDDVQMCLMAQFAINKVLEKKLLTVEEECERTKEELPQQLFKELNCQSVEEAKQMMDTLKEKNEALAASRQQVYQSGKRIQRQMMEVNKTNSEQQTKIDQLILQNETLQNQVNLLEVKYQVAVNESMMTASKVEDNSTFDQSVVMQLEEENKSLSLQLQESMSQNTIKENDKIKKLKKKEAQLKQMIMNMQSENETLKNESREYKKKAKKRIQDLNNQYQEMINKQNSQWEESKQQLMKTVNQMKQKMIESRDMTNEKVAALHDSEKRVQQISTENSRLQMMHKTMQVQLSAMQEQIEKEKQNARTQISAQQVACESRIQDMSRQVQNQLNKQKQELTEQLITVLIETRGDQGQIASYATFQDVVDQLKEALQ